MRVALFIPCYVDQLYPRVGLATLAVLERHGVTVVYPEAQTCCGQPLANSGFAADAAPLARRFLEIFRDHEYVVAPTGSCVSMVRHHYQEHLAGLPGAEHLVTHTYELCEFLVDVLKIERVEGHFAHAVGLHHSCHGLRELRLASGSERRIAAFDKPRALLEGLRDIRLVTLRRPDECCGFGGTFAIAEEAVSCMMGKDRIADHQQAGAEIVTAVDMSCLMHLEGLIRRAATPLKVMHIAEILDQATAR